MVHIVLWWISQFSKPKSVSPVQSAIDRLPSWANTGSRSWCTSVHQRPGHVKRTEGTQHHRRPPSLGPLPYIHCPFFKAHIAHMQTGTNRYLPVSVHCWFSDALSFSSLGHSETRFSGCSDICGLQTTHSDHKIWILWIIQTNITTLILPCLLLLLSPGDPDTASFKRSCSSSPPPSATAWGTGQTLQAWLVLGNKASNQSC